MDDGSDRRMQGLSDVYTSVKNYYYLSGGRVLAHFILFTVNLADKWVFNIINSIMFTLLGILIYGSVNKQIRDQSPLLLPAIYTTVIFISPKFADNVLWQAGAVNYLWVSCLLLCCVIFFRNNIESNSLPKNICIVLLTLLTSLASEVSGGMIMIVYFLYWLSHNNKKRIIWFILTATATAGIAFVITAPGNEVRAEVLNNTNLFSFKDTLSVALIIINWAARKYILLIIFMALSFTYALKKHKKLICELDKCSYFIAGLAGILALSAAGYFHNDLIRASFTGSILLITSVFMQLNDISDLIKELPAKVTLRPSTAVKAGKICFGISAVYFAYKLFRYAFSNDSELLILTSIEAFLMLIFIALLILLFKKIPQDKSYILDIEQIKENKTKIIFISSIIVLSFTAANTVGFLVNAKADKTILKDIENFSYSQQESMKIKKYHTYKHMDSIFSTSVGKINYTYAWMIKYYGVGAELNGDEKYIILYRDPQKLDYSL